MGEVANETPTVLLANMDIAYSEHLPHRMDGRLLGWLLSPLERLLQPRLGEHGVGRVSGLDVAVNRKAAVGDGAVLNFMVATAMPHETALR